MKITEHLGNAKNTLFSFEILPPLKGQSLKELLEVEKYKKYQDSIAVYNLSQTKKAGIKTYKYTFEGFKDAIDTETEIRQ